MVTLAKAERHRRQVIAGENAVQKATDEAYAALLNLYLTAEQHALSCSQIAEQNKEPGIADGMRSAVIVGGDAHSYWPGNTHVESVLAYAVTKYPVLGNNNASRVVLPILDRRVPPPAGCTFEDLLGNRAPHRY